MGKSCLVWVSVVFAVLAWVVVFFDTIVAANVISSQAEMLSSIVFTIVALIFSIVGLKDWKKIKIFEKVLLVCALAVSIAAALLWIFSAILLSSGNLM